ncbi:MAG TPA: DNA translocase FtsK 4TM domain-containing protein, partial [Actinomycetota bacterium]
MPTKTSPSRASGRSGARKRPQARTSGRKTPKKKTPVRIVLSPWARDALGIGLLVLALLAVLSLWLEAGGPLGDAIAYLLPAVFGVGAYAFPVVGTWWGIVLLRDTVREERVRMFIGFCVLLLGVLGIVSLAMGNPSFASGWDGVDGRGFGHAGGLIGVLGAWPLSRVLSAAGAAIVCGGLSVLGTLIFTGTPFSVIVERFREFREAREERDAAEAAEADDGIEETRYRWS